MWIAELESFDLSGDVLTAVISYTDGTNIIKEKIRTTQNQADDWLSNVAANKIATLEGLYSFAATLRKGIIPPPVTKASLPEDEKKAAFADALTELNKLALIKDAGADVTQRIADLKVFVSGEYAKDPELVKAI